MEQRERRGRKWIVPLLLLLGVLGAVYIFLELIKTTTDCNPVPTGSSGAVFDIESEIEIHFPATTSLTGLEVCQVTLLNKGLEYIVQPSWEQIGRFVSVSGIKGQEYNVKILHSGELYGEVVDVYYLQEIIFGLSFWYPINTFEVNSPSEVSFLMEHGTEESVVIGVFVRR